MDNLPIVKGEVREDPNIGLVVAISVHPGTRGSVGYGLVEGTVKRFTSIKEWRSFKLIRRPKEDQGA